jgi:hypothetical protein
MRTITRRSFVKRTAFSAAAISILGQGIAMANPGGSSGTGCDGDCSSWEWDDAQIYFNFTEATKEEPFNGDAVHFRKGKCICSVNSDHTVVSSHTTSDTLNAIYDEENFYHNEVKHKTSGCENHP